MKRIWFSFSLTVLVFAGCSSEITDPRSAGDDLSTPQRPIAKPAPKRIPVLTARLEKRVVHERLALTGTTQIMEQFSVSPEVGGRLAALHFDEGQWVKKGQVMAELDRTKRHLEAANRKAQLSKAQVELRFAVKNFERAESLLAKGAISQSEVDALEEAVKLAESAVDLAKISLQIIDQELEDTFVKAAASGQVSRRLVSLGENVSPGDSLFEVIQYDPIEVITEIPEIDFFSVDRSRGVELTFDALPGRRFLGRIHRVAPQANTRSGAFRVEIRVPNPGHRLRAGMVARLQMGGSVFADALVAPMDALVDGAEGGLVVFKVEDGLAKRVPAKLIHRFGDEAIIEGDLKEGDELVTRGSVNLTDETPVEVTSGGPKSEREGRHRPAGGSSTPTGASGL